LRLGYRHQMSSRGDDWGLGVRASVPTAAAVRRPCEISAINVADAPLEVTTRSRYTSRFSRGRGSSPVVEERIMKALLVLSRTIDRFNETIGKWIAWLVVAAALVSAGNAVIRKLLDTSSNAWLELQWWLFGMVFLLCAPWTLSSNEHIRIDIVNNLFPRWLKNAVEVIGHAFFLLPVCLVMLYTAIPFFITSFLQNEQSANAGGLPLYPPKFLIPLGFALLLMQGISELIKRFAIIRGHVEGTAFGGGHHAAAEAEAQRLHEDVEAKARKH
jgi:TRAP-type mannitol/chloroaromatic compound transport system permease small subunit